MFSFRFCNSLSGHNQALTVSHIAAQDILEIEEFAKTVTDIMENARKKVSSNSIQSMLHHFYGLYGSKKEFKFPPGDKKLLQLIAGTVTSKLELDVNFFDNDTYLSNCNMTSTPFGDVFCDKAVEHSQQKK